MSDWDLRDEWSALRTTRWRMARLEVDIGASTADGNSTPEKLSGQVRDATVRELLCMSASLNGDAAASQATLLRFHRCLSQLYHVPGTHGGQAGAGSEDISGVDIAEASSIPLSIAEMRRWALGARPPLRPRHPSLPSFFWLTTPEQIQ